MPRFLWRATYTTAGIRGLFDEGGTRRREAIERVTVEELGGIVEAFHFAFGDRDVVVIAALGRAAARPGGVGERQHDVLTLASVGRAPERCRVDEGLPLQHPTLDTPDAR